MRQSVRASSVSWAGVAGSGGVCDGRVRNSLHTLSWLKDFSVWHGRKHVLGAYVLRCPLSRATWPSVPFYPSGTPTAIKP